MINIVNILYSEFLCLDYAYLISRTVMHTASIISVIYIRVSSCTQNLSDIKLLAVNSSMSTALHLFAIGHCPPRYRLKKL